MLRRAWLGRASAAHLATAFAARPRAPAFARTLCNFPLHSASESGDVHEVENLLGAGGQDVDAPDPARQGTTALLLSVRKGHRGVVERLLRAGADPCRAGAWGFTPLMYASIWGRPEIAEDLVGAGAGKRESLLARDARGDTALDHAVGERQWACARIVVREMASAGCLGADPALDALAYRVASDAGSEAGDSGPDGVDSSVEADHSGNVEDEPAGRRGSRVKEAFARNSALLKERKAREEARRRV